MRSVGSKVTAAMRGEDCSNEEETKGENAMMNRTETKGDKPTNECMVLLGRNSTSGQKDDKDKGREVGGDGQRAEKRN